MDENSLDFLVDKTFEMNQADSLPEHFDEVPSIPASPGVLYLIEKVKYVTQLKLSESPNLYKDFSDLIKAQHSIEDLNFFEVDSYADAQFLARTFDKFKLLKKSVEIDTQSYNQTWWGGTLDSGEFFIAFGKNLYKDVQSKFELGPLGDSAVAKHYLGMLSKKLKTLEIKDNGSNIVLTASDSQIGNNLEAFLLGKTDEFIVDLENPEADGLEQLEILSLKRYFRELSLVRNFWTAVSDQVSENAPTYH